MNDKGHTTDRYEDEAKIAVDSTDEHALDETHQPIYDDEEVRKIRRKIDWRVLPLLTFLYLISYVDRGNIGNANVAGLSEDLGLSGSQYNLALTVSNPSARLYRNIDLQQLFFIPYVLFEVPSNVVLKLMRPSWWIAIIVTAWGAVSFTVRSFYTSSRRSFSYRWFSGKASYKGTRLCTFAVYSLALLKLVSSQQPRTC